MGQKEENLTCRKGIAELTSDLNTQPGYDLVLFKKIGGGGLELLTVLSPGEKLRFSSLRNPSHYVACKVTRDRQLRHEFEREVFALDKNRYTLHFVIFFYVTGPERLAEGLKADPLLRLEMEVARAVTARAHRLHPDSVAGSHQFQAEIWKHEADAAGTVQSPLERLRQFARRLGIEIEEIKVEYSLPKEAWEEYKKYGIEQLKKKLEHKISLMDNTYKGLRDGVSEMAGMIHRALHQVKDLPEASQALRDLQGIQNQLARLVSNLSGEEDSNVGYPSPNPAPAQSEAPRLAPSSNGALRNLLVATCEKMSLIDADQRRVVQSSILHLLGEVILQEEADKVIVEKHRESLQRHLRELVRNPVFGRDQIAFVRRVIDTKTLQEDLEQ